MSIAKKHAHTDFYNMKETVPKDGRMNPNQECWRTQYSSPTVYTKHSDGLCTHEMSVMEPSHPNFFTRFPYRPAVMALLRQVQTFPVDIIAQDHQGSDAPRVYASFQNHWSPEINVPVLTLVGACNTVLSPPMIKRRYHDWVNINCLASTAVAQHDVNFKLPLIMQQSDAPKPVVLDIIFASSFGDHFSIYMVRNVSETQPLLLVKIWNLTNHGCDELHNAGLYLPPRASFKEELHVLGLSGDRKCAFRVSFPYIGTNPMMMLNEDDLTAIGHKQVWTNLPAGRHVTTYREQNNITTLMSRMTPVEPSRLLDKRYTVTITPCPPFIYYKPDCKFPTMYPRSKLNQFYTKTIKASLFPTGFFTFRNIHLPDNTTVQDILNELQYAKGRFDPSAYSSFAKYCKVAPQILKENKNMPFKQFLCTITQDSDPTFTSTATKPIDNLIPAKQHEVVADYDTLMATVLPEEEETYTKSIGHVDKIRKRLEIQNKLAEAPTVEAAKQVLTSQLPDQTPQREIESDQEWIEKRINQSMIRLEKQVEKNKEQVKALSDEHKAREEYLQKRSHKNQERLKKEFQDLCKEFGLEPTEKDDEEKSTTEEEVEKRKKAQKEEEDKRKKTQEEKEVPPVIVMKTTNSDGDEEWMTVQRKKPLKKRNPKRTADDNEPKEKTIALNTEEQTALVQGILNADPNVIQQLQKILKTKN